jgi:hypothetical protein
LGNAARILKKCNLALKTMNEKLTEINKKAQFIGFICGITLFVLPRVKFYFFFNIIIREGCI